MTIERLQKVIARAGLSSRRAAEQLITDGRVRVNGKIVTELGTKVDPSNDDVEVDGKKLLAESFVYLVLHKPRLVVSTLSDPEGRPTVKDLLKGVTARVYPVGRLDFHTSGVLLFTNDGEMTQGLLHPKKVVPKTYVVKVNGEMTDADVLKWRKGVMLDDGITRPAEVTLIRHEAEKTWLEVTLYEGRNQQIRRMGEATGFPVMRLARQSFAGVTVEGLKPGALRPMTVDELTAMREHWGVPRRIRRPEMLEKPSHHGPPKDRRAPSVVQRAKEKHASDRSGRDRSAAGKPDRTGKTWERGAGKPQRGAADVAATKPERGAKPQRGGRPIAQKPSDGARSTRPAGRPRRSGR